MMFHRLMWTNFVNYILAIHLFLSISVNSTSHFSNFTDFRQRQIPNTLTKFYLLIPRHLMIQLTKLQVCILNLSTTFRLCRKKSDYFWTRVYTPFASGEGPFFLSMDAHAPMIANSHWLSIWDLRTLYWEHVEGIVWWWCIHALYRTCCHLKLYWYYIILVLRVNRDKICVCKCYLDNSRKE